jgi:hypothetical protein
MTGMLGRITYKDLGRKFYLRKLSHPLHTTVKRTMNKRCALGSVAVLDLVPLLSLHLKASVVLFYDMKLMFVLLASVYLNLVFY